MAVAADAEEAGKDNGESKKKVIKKKTSVVTGKRGGEEDEQEAGKQKKRKVTQASAGKGGATAKKSDDEKKAVNKRKKKDPEGSPSSSKEDEGDKKQKSSTVKVKSDSPWSCAWKGRPRLDAVLEGLGRVFNKAQSREGTAEDREMLVECLHLVARVTTDPVREQALKYADEAADRWKQSCLTRPWKLTPSPPPSSVQRDSDAAPTPPAESPPTTQELLGVLPRIYQMERVGVHHDLKAHVQAHLTMKQHDGMATTSTDTSAAAAASSGRYTAKDYLGWDPVTEPPPDHILHDPKDPTRLLSRYEALSQALRHAFYADRLGLSLGTCTYRDVLQWLPKMRPYKGPGELPLDVYRAQCHLIVTVVETLSDLGELRLPASLMPHEFLFVREHLGALMRRRDLLLIAHFLVVLHIFGSDDNDEVCLAAMAYLLGTQGPPAGSWDRAMAALKADEEDTERASVLAVKALLVHSPRGYGPGIPGLVSLLLTWQRADADPANSDEPTMADLPPEPANLRSLPMLPSGEYDRRAQRMERLVTRMIMESRRKVEVEEDEEEEDEEDDVVVVKTTAAAKQQGEEDEHLPVRERVMKLGKTMEEGRDAANWRTVFEALKALKKLSGIDKGVLEDTKIGKVVGKLRKAPNEQVAALSRRIIERWKQMIEATMEGGGAATSETTAPAAGTPMEVSLASNSGTTVTMDVEEEEEQQS